MPLTKQRIKYGLATLVMLTALFTPHHSFAMQFMDGKGTQIEALTGKGRWTVFKIWASDCHVCNKTIRYMEDLTLVYPEADVFGFLLIRKSEMQKVL